MDNCVKSAYLKSFWPKMHLENNLSGLRLLKEGSNVFWASVPNSQQWVYDGQASLSVSTVSQYLKNFNSII